MRRRWHVPEDFGWFLFGFWLLGWLPIYLVVYALFVPGGLGGTDDTVSPIFFGAWFGLPCLGAFAYFAPRCARWLWSCRPRRVWESAPDIRKVYRREN